ncbi:hypothetical protein QJS66_23665 (plasmid) [Kocuria rhizophila]|nr:hypothetical protein QJS66_23665 [Kocuria rhizophila]
MIAAENYLVEAATTSQVIPAATSDAFDRAAWKRPVGGGAAL